MPKHGGNWLELFEAVKKFDVIKRFFAQYIVILHLFDVSLQFARSPRDLTLKSISLSLVQGKR
jgi:hypothetical protein